MYEELIEKGADGVWFYKTLVEDVNMIRREAVKLGYSILDETRKSK